jgi:hypothetical protein
MYRMDEHGHGRSGDGGELIGDVLLTGVKGVSKGNMAKNSGLFSASQLSSWVGSGTREKWSSKDG